MLQGGGGRRQQGGERGWAASTEEFLSGRRRGDLVLNVLLGVACHLTQGGCHLAGPLPRLLCVVLRNSAHKVSEDTNINC